MRYNVLCGSIAIAINSFGGDRPIPYILNDSSGERSIGLYTMYLDDPTAQLSAAKAWAADGYTRSLEAIPNFSVSESARWLKFEISNHSASANMVLAIPYSEIDELDLYSISDGAIVQIGKTGRLVDRSEKNPESGEFLFNLSIPTGTSAEYLVRLWGFKPIHLPLVVSNIELASISKSNRIMLQGLYAGIMIAMALYNLFLYISIRDKNYLLYVMYILSICSAQLTFLGSDPTGLWTKYAWFDARSSIFFALIAIILGLEFGRRFINTKNIVPNLHKYVPIFYLLVAANIGVYATVDAHIGYQLAQALGGLSAIYVFTMAMITWRRGSRPAGYFLVAWTMFLLGVIVFVLKDAGVLPFNTLTQHAMPIGSAIEGILLSFGLADRINVLRREKEASQAEALEASIENERIIREQNTLLERKVKERTHALEESHESLKQTQTQLVNAEKMASLGQLTAGIAHEINNPINFITSNVAPLRRNIADIVEVIKGYQGVEAEHAAEQLATLRDRAERIGLEESISELDDIIASIAEGSSRTAEIVRGLRNFSRLDEDDLKDADLNDGLRSTLTVLGPQYRDKVSFNLELGDIPKVECFPGKVNQVFMNIMTNAVQATLARADLSKREVSIRTSYADGSVNIRIADNGIGMSDAVKARVFEPFFTTKGVGEGTGLGMAIVYGIINDHGGSIAIDSMPGAGTEFTITLPLRQERRMQKRA
jgi:signal transduction histidine kinase